MSRSLDPAEEWLRENDPEYLAARQAFKHARGSSYGSPFEEIPVATAEEVVTAGAKDQLAPEDQYDADREVVYEVERDKLSHRRKDRHKGPRDRAAYMREYRARQKSASA